jgi:hypothetical protein
MSNYLVIDPVKPEDGLDYIFVYMSAAYGNSFIRQWEGVDSNMVRQVWTKTVGEFLKSKPILDHALNNLPPDFPPSAMAFAELCRKSPDTMDISTLAGINKLADKLQLPRWNDRGRWHEYRQQIIETAKQRGLL